MRTKMKPPIDKSGTSAGSMGDQVGCRGFKSLFQGDHLEVEFALSSHITMLKGVGLLDEPYTEASPFSPRSSLAGDCH